MLDLIYILPEFPGYNTVPSELATEPLIPGKLLQFLELFEWLWNSESEKKLSSFGKKGDIALIALKGV